MNEPDVTLTNFTIALECLVFVGLLLRRPRVESRAAWVLLFAATAFGAIAGGLVHGYHADTASAWFRLFWPLSLTGIVLAALGLALVATARLALAPQWERLTQRVLVVLAAAFGVAILAGMQSFVVAVAAFVPASLMFAAVHAWRAVRDHAMGDALGVAGALLAVLAGVLQQLHYTPLPGSVTYNAFFHLVQMLALALVYQASRHPTPR